MVTPNVNIAVYNLHPILKSIFKQLDRDDLARATDNIRVHGQRAFIEAVNGQVVSGLIEYQACIEAGIAPQVTEIEPPPELVEFIVRRNVPSENFNYLDRACIAVLAKAEFLAEGRRRMKEAGRIGGLSKGKGREEVERPFQGQRWYEAAAKLVGIKKNPGSIRDLDTIHTHAPDVFEAVRTHLVTKVSEAKSLMKMVPDKKDRNEILARIKNIPKLGVKPAIYDHLRKKYIETLPEGVFDSKRYRILVGDMAEQAVPIEDNFADLVYADIEYGPPRCHEMVAKAAKIAARVLKDGGIFALIGGHVHFDELAQAVTREGLKGVAIGFLCYPNASHGLADHANLVQRVDADYVMFFVKGSQLKRPITHLMYKADPVISKNHHKWEKPLGATRDMIESAAGHGAIVVDVCCGGGTVGEATLRLNGYYIGIDIDPKAADVTARRLTRVDEELREAERERADRELAVMVEREKNRSDREPRKMRIIPVIPEIRKRSEKSPVTFVVKDSLLVLRRSAKPTPPVLFRVA